MGRNISIYIDDEMERAPSARSTEDGQRSAVLREIVQRYDEIVRRDAPELSEPEWKAVADALDGTILDSTTLRFAWAEVADADRINGLGVKWGIDAQALAARIRDLTQGQLTALVDRVERFWSAVSRGEDPEM